MPTLTVTDTVYFLRTCRLSPTVDYFQAVTVARLSQAADDQDKLLLALSKQSQLNVYSTYTGQVKPNTIAVPPLESWTSPLTATTKGPYAMKDYPFTAVGMLGKVAKGKHVGFCTGYVISNMVDDVWVLTAAHCVYNLTSKLPTHPSLLRFYPQLHGGKLADGFNGEQGYPVWSITLPSWYVQLPAVKGSPLRSEEYFSWDVALLRLWVPGGSLPCQQTHCRLGLGYVSGGSELLHKFRVAGYGKPSTNQLRYSIPCELRLNPGVPYHYHYCPTTSGHSGSPVYLHGGVPNKYLPPGVKAYIWPAMGVHHGKAPTRQWNAFTKFNYAHLKWVYYAGVEQALYYGCTGLGLTPGDASCVVLKTERW